VTNPDAPAEPLTTARLEAVRAAATHYLRECADDPPLTAAEQVLALAVAGVMPTIVYRRFGDTDQARLAWVVASCCFLRLELPANEHLTAAGLYALLDELEMFTPAAWVETYAAIERMIPSHRSRPGDDPDMGAGI